MVIRIKNLWVDTSKMGMEFIDNNIWVRRQSLLKSNYSMSRKIWNKKVFGFLCSLILGQNHKFLMSLEFSHSSTTWPCNSSPRPSTEALTWCNGESWPTLPSWAPSRRLSWFSLSRGADVGGLDTIACKPSYHVISLLYTSKNYSGVILGFKITFCVTISFFSVFSCEATLDNTQNVPNSLTIPL